MFPSMKAAVTRVRSSLNPRPPSQYPDWASILKPAAARWQFARAAAKNGPKVLIATSGGYDHHVTTIDSFLAVALTLRGADVHVLMCDEALPACWLSHNQRIPPHQFVKSGPSEKLCGECFLNGYKVFRALGLPIHKYGDLVSTDDLRSIRVLSETVPTNEIGSFRLDGLQIGEHALAGALRYYARGSLRGESQDQAVLRRYFSASLMSAYAMRRLLATCAFESICGIHGMYVPEGPIGAVARSQNVRVACWNEGYRKQTLIFSHHDTYHKTMLSEPTANWENMPWTEEMETEILEYLRSRWYGTHDWIGYTQDWSDDLLSIATQLGIDFTKPCVGLLTNVIWDAQVHYGGNAFSSMLEWTLETIKYFCRRPDLQLIVRIHPAETRGIHRSQQLMVEEIKRAIPNLPKNVFVISPESPMNTYAAMLKCNAVIIYGTKVGVELSSHGIPVIVAGEAWIRNKGLTLDASSAQEYYEILDRLPLRERMSDASVQQARKYAYHYFFRRLIPLPFLRQGGRESLFNLEISGLEDLLPGRHPGLDVICNGIIKGDEFIYPAESYPQYVSGTGKFTTNYSARLSARVSNKSVVSVIIPTYNHSNSLPDALDSVHAQEGVGKQFDIEVILVDNASSDITAQIASRYSGVQYIRLENETTVSTVRNIGLKAAKGKYVAFLDDGDHWLPERLCSQVAVLETYPEFGAVYGQFVASVFGKDVLWPEAGAAPAGSVFRAFLTEEFAVSSVLTARREAFEKAGYFDETLRGFEHYDMSLRLASFVRFAFVSGPVAGSRFSKDSAWSSRIQRGQHQIELPYILNKAFALLPNNFETAALKREVIGLWFTKIAHYLDKSETVELLRSHILNWIRQYPWMMTDPASLSSMVNYASKVLSRTLEGSSRFNHPAVRSFCRDVTGAQNGNYEQHAFQARRFLGETLTRTATHMLDQGNLKAAGYTATCAVCQDLTQIIRQIRGTSRRLIRTLFPATS